MRVLLAGATGALGRRLVPMLVQAGHDVVGTTRTPEKAEVISRAGAEPVVMDALDASSVRRALSASRPDAVVHQLTALTGRSDLRNFDATFAGTNALRITGTDNLLAAAQEAAVARFVAQSYTGWPNARSGTGLKTEADLLDPAPPRNAVQTLAAIRHVEEVVPAAEGVVGLVLRYGAFYGPGTSLGDDGELVEMVRRRKLPLVGGGAGVWSFVHIDDAARATVAALGHGGAGLAGPGGRRGAGPGGDDPEPRLVERQGQAGPGLAAGVADLAGRLRRRPRLTGQISATAPVGGIHSRPTAPSTGCRCAGRRPLMPRRARDPPPCRKPVK